MSVPPSLDEGTLGDKRFFYFVDEVGRGCLAGPVVTCTISYSLTFNQMRELDILLKFLKKIHIQDSKKLSPIDRRLSLAQLGIRDVTKKKFSIHLRSPKAINPVLSIHFSIGIVSPSVIDRINILQATMLSMKQSTEVLMNKNYDENKKCFTLDKSVRHFVFIDGNRAPLIDNEKWGAVKVTPIIRGDSILTGISLASIYAKEFRDELMNQMDTEFPEYQLNKHKGYGTSVHRELIKIHGPSVIHRKSFAGVKEYDSLR
ncbi:MAG: ribonuclease HII [Bacteriovoracaceae bacterium]|nr:ribonuclease HII [Bacteriovoracaceae bacterium]